MNMFWDKCVGCNIREDCIDFGKLSELGLFLNFSSIVKFLLTKDSLYHTVKNLFNNYGCSFYLEA